MTTARLLRSVVGALVLTLLAAAAPATAADDVVTLTFETGPPLGSAITTEYETSHFVLFQRSDAQRPARRSAPGAARSGTVVANIGADRCVPEGGTGNDCEFAVGGTYGRLTRTASSLRIFAGLFEPASQPVTVQLEAIRANGSVAATGPPVPIGAGGFTTEVAVTSAAPDIARFRVLVGGDGRAGAAVGFDDLTMTFPENTLPDVSLGLPPDAVAVLQGQTVDVPVSITRLNGSSGPLDLAVSGLPQGVTAEFTPDPAPGTTSAATLRLRAAADAPPSASGVPQTVTVTGDPQSNGAVAPAPRTASLPVRVGAPFAWRAPPATPVALPTCATTDVPLRVERDRAFTGRIALAVGGLPAGVDASFLPSTEIAPGGGFVAEVTLRLRGPVAPVPASRLTLSATSPGSPAQQVPLDLRAAAPAAALQAASLTAPMFLRAGTTSTLTGNGFCAGTKVQIGTSAGEAAGTVEDDGRTLRFTTPRLATPGRVTVVPPQGPAYAATGSATVRTYRATNGLSFGNFPFTGLSLTEAADVFGYDELFFKVNPCWPWSDCSIITPVPDPTALLAYGIIDRAMQSTGGHCFGISRAVQLWTSNPTTLNRFTSGPDVFSIPGRTAALDSYLDGQHSVQASTEFIQRYFRRSKTINGNLEVIREQLRSGRAPLVAMAYDDGSGHAVLAYDVVDRPDGGVDLLLYDNNVPFDPAELISASSHTSREADRSVIRIAPDRQRWEFQSGGGVKSGGGDALFASAQNDIPLNPSLPGAPLLLEGLAYLIFGSADGSVRSVGRSAGSDYLPALDENAIPGAGGAVGTTAGGPLSHTVRGVKAGRYTQAVVGRGVIGAVDAPTAAGVEDTTSSAPGGDGVRFASARGAPARSIDLEVGTRSGRASRTAAVTTRTTGGATETVRLPGGARLVYAHDGPATTASFVLTGVQTNGGPARFASGPLRVRRGDTLTARPASWRDFGGGVRLTVRSASGRSRTATLRNRAAAPAGLSLTRPRIRGRRASVTVRFARLPEYAGAGVVLRAMRGSRIVARRAFRIETPRPGARTLRWTLPRSVRGRGLRLVADATLAVGGARTGTVRRRTSVRLAVR